MALTMSQRVYWQVNPTAGLLSLARVLPFWNDTMEPLHTCVRALHAGARVHALAPLASLQASAAAAAASPLSSQHSAPAVREAEQVHVATMNLARDVVEASSWCDPLAVWIMARAAEVSLGPKAALALLDAGPDDWRTYGAPWAVARVEAARGFLLAEQGRSDEARQVLTAGVLPKLFPAGSPDVRTWTDAAALHLRLHSQPQGPSGQSEGSSPRHGGRSAPRDEHQVETNVLLSAAAQLALPRSNPFLAALGPHDGHQRDPDHGGAGARIVEIEADGGGFGGLTHAFAPGLPSHHHWDALALAAIFDARESKAKEATTGSLHHGAVSYFNARKVLYPHSEATSAMRLALL